MTCLVEKEFISKVSIWKVNTSFYSFQTETLVTLTNAKNTGYSEVLIFILEPLSEVKPDCREILSGALILNLKMTRGFDKEN